MTTARKTSVASLSLTAFLVVAPALGATAAAADGTGSTGTKAQVEYSERLAAAEPSTKAAIEHREMLERQSSTGSQTTQVSPDSGTTSSGDAAAWQLALSAALGALVTGVAFVGGRQVSSHRSAGHAVAQ